MKALLYETPVDSEEEFVARVVAAAGDIAEIPNALEALEYVRQKVRKVC